MSSPFISYRGIILDFFLALFVGVFSVSTVIAQEEDGVKTPSSPSKVIRGSEKDLSEEVLDTETPSFNPETTEEPRSEMPKDAEPEKVVKPKPRKAKKISTHDDYHKSGVLGSFLIGPSVTVLAVPMVLRAGLELKFQHFIGVAYDFGVIPDVTISGVGIKASQGYFGLRWYPFEGAFFAGVNIGQQKISATKTDEIQGVKVKGDVEVQSKIIIPQIGWRWMWSSGFFMGMDLGLQYATDATTSFATDAPAAIQSTTDYLNLKKDVEDLGNGVGKTTLPFVTFLQFGFYF